MKKDFKYLLDIQTFAEEQATPTQEAPKEDVITDESSGVNAKDTEEQVAEESAEPKEEEKGEQILDSWLEKFNQMSGEKTANEQLLMEQIKSMEEKVGILTKENLQLKVDAAMKDAGGKPEFKDLIEAFINQSGANDPIKAITELKKRLPNLFMENKEIDTNKQIGKKLW